MILSCEVIPTRSRKLQLKQFCMGIFTYIIGSIQIICNKIRTVKIFVVTVLSHRHGRTNIKHQYKTAYCQQYRNEFCQFRHKCRLFILVHFLSLLYVISVFQQRLCLLLVQQDKVYLQILLLQNIH